MIECWSTHGGSGYVKGSHWDGDDIICGHCGFRITNPNPTGGRWVHEKGWRGWLLNRGHSEPTWPNFILGQRGKPWDTAARGG